MLINTNSPRSIFLALNLFLQYILTRYERLSRMVLKASASWFPPSLTKLLVARDIYFGNVGAWRYLEWWMNVRQALSSEKRFLSPRQGLNPQPSDDRWDALTIDLPRLRWWAKVQVWHVCGLSRSHCMLKLWWNKNINILKIYITLITLLTFSGFHSSHTYVELAP